MHMIAVYTVDSLVINASWFSDSLDSTDLFTVV